MRNNVYPIATTNMEVKQIYELVNNAMSDVLGETDVEDSPTLSETLDNLVDMGDTIQNALKLDNYVRSLVNHIGKVIFVNRPYAGSAPSVLMDSWEYGSILEKVQSEMPVAVENATWELEDGKSYDPNIFYQPKASAKFYNSRTTFEIDLSFTERQVKESFSNAAQMNAFLSMLYNEVDKSMTVKTDDLVMRTINNMTAHTLVASNSGIKVVNLLKEYNDTVPASEKVTVAGAIYDPGFIRFSAYKIGLYADRIKKISRLFNLGNKARFTPRDKLHLIMLSEYEMAANVFLQSDVYHNELTRLPMAESVPYWQGSGTNYGFENTSAIAVKIGQGSSAQTVEQTGILAVMFDRDALGVTNLDRRVTTNYNPKAEFFTNFYKFECGFYNDEDENYIVFVVSE